MEPAPPKDTRAGNVAAFLDTLAFAEGTPRFGNQDGFNVIVGGKTFNSYDDHPRQRVGFLLMRSTPAQRVGTSS